MNIDKRSIEQSALREKLATSLNDFPGHSLQLLNHLQLFQRSSVIARILHLQEAYERILNQPGNVLQIGVHYGSTMAVFLSLRAIYEPYNYSRKIIGIDTFESQPSKSRQGEHPDIFTDDKYGQFFEGPEYIHFLAEVLNNHEAENTMPHIRKWEILQGEVVEQIETLTKRKDFNLSLLYFDFPFPKSTLTKIFSILSPFFQKGLVIIPYSINNYLPTGELDVIRNTFSYSSFQFIMDQSKFIPEKNYITLT